MDPQELDELARLMATSNPVPKHQVIAMQAYKLFFNSGCDECNTLRGLAIGAIIGSAFTYATMR